MFMVTAMTRNIIKLVNIAIYFIVFAYFLTFFEEKGYVKVVLHKKYLFCSKG